MFRKYGKSGSLFFAVDGQLLDQKIDAAKGWPEGSRNIGFQMQQQGDEVWASQLLFGNLPPLGKQGK